MSLAWRVGLKTIKPCTRSFVQGLNLSKVTLGNVNDDFHKIRLMSVTSEGKGTQEKPSAQVK